MPSKGQIATQRTALVRLGRWAPNGVKEVLAALGAQGAQAVLVGGAVRDAYLGLRSADWDVATDLVPEAVAKLFPRVVRAGEKHGTIMVLTGDGPVEVTTFRSEGAYEDGRRPSSVTFHGDLEGDLSRRDFTINAMAADLAAGRIADPFGGETDLAGRLVRCVGLATERFAEDGLRPLRAVRFAAVLGFRLEKATLLALPTALATFEKVAWERKREELTRLLGRGQDLPAAVALLAQSGMLASLAPELLPASGRRLRALDELPPGAPWLRFAGWAHLAGCSPEAARQILARWRVATRDARLAEAWLQALSLLRRRRLPTPVELRRWVGEVGEEAARGAAVLSAALWGGAFERLPAKLVALLRARPVVRLDQLAVGGHDLVRLGLSGPAVGQTLDQLLEAVIVDPRKNRKSTLLSLAHKLSTGPS